MSEPFVATGLPDAGYSPAHPLLEFGRQSLLEHGWTLQQLWWDQSGDWHDREHPAEWVRQQATVALDADADVDRLLCWLRPIVPRPSVTGLPASTEISVIAARRPFCSALPDGVSRSTRISTVCWTCLTRVVLVGTLASVQLDERRPAQSLTRQSKRHVLTWLTVAPITSTIRGITSEVPVGPRNGLEHDSVVSCDDITTVRTSAVGDTIGLLFDDQEPALARAISDASRST